MDTHLDVFRGAFRHRNSDVAIRRFPFPFDRDEYMYVINMEPHRPDGPSDAFATAFDIDEHYEAECAERAHVLAQDPLRCQVLPHMDAAEWDTVELLMDSLARDFPQDFGVAKDGEGWRWTNRRLGIVQDFTFGDRGSLPCGPFEYITRQAQGDFTLQDQRDGTLWMDGGMVTTQADWSLDFDLGMHFHEWHGPVPVAHEHGVFDRALRYLLAVKAGGPARRLNWTITMHARLDTSPENFPVWGPDRGGLTAENCGRVAHLRVELQSFFRLPRSNALLFPIRCYLIAFDELVRVPDWGRRLHRVLRDLHPEIAAYKGMAQTRDTMVAWLAARDDGAVTAAGTAQTELVAVQA